MGTVSASGATTLSDLHQELAQKADEAGAGAYRIVAAGGENQMHGVAVIYK
jgi:succinyl-CoA synthetase alpha subunit